MLIIRYIPSSFYDNRNMIDCSNFGNLYGWSGDIKRIYKMQKEPNSQVMRLNYISYYYSNGIINRYASFDDEDGDGYSFEDTIKYDVKEADIDEVINNDFYNLIGDYNLLKWSSKTNKIFTYEDDLDD